MRTEAGDGGRGDPVRIAHPARRAASLAALEALLADLDVQDILSLNLSRAVQLCVDRALHELARRGLVLPETMGAAFVALAEQGLRETALAGRLRCRRFSPSGVHRYRDIDWAVVQQLLDRHLSDFDGFSLAWIRMRQSD